MRIELLERASLALATIGILTALACGLAGCATADAPSTATSSPTATLLPAATLSPTTPPFVVAPICATSRLTLTATPESVSQGRAVTLFRFTNVSKATCSLRGFPSVLLLDASGKPLRYSVATAEQAYSWKPTLVKTINLPPEGSAWFRSQTQETPMQGGDMSMLPGETCPVAARTIISPPDAAPAFVSSVNLSTCDGLVVLSPLVANPSDF